jgi:hypothetical protein
MTAFLKSSNWKIFSLLALTAMVLTTTLPAHAVSSAEVERILSQTKFTGACCFNFGEKVTATEGKTIAPVIVTFSMDYTSGAEFWIGLDVNGHGCNFYGSRENPATSIFFPAAYMWVIDSGDGVLVTGKNTFELCGGGAPGYSSGTLLIGYNTLAARTGN